MIDHPLLLHFLGGYVAFAFLAVVAFGVLQMLIDKQSAELDRRLALYRARFDYGGSHEKIHV